GLLQYKDEDEAAVIPPAEARAEPGDVTEIHVAVEHALQYLRENLHRQHTLSDIAWKMQLSGEHLERLFRRDLGCTVFECLREIRLEHAKSLLQSTEERVVEIARLSGYSSKCLFFRHFKSSTGQTPLVYRIQRQKLERYIPSRLTED